MRLAAGRLIVLLCLPGSCQNGVKKSPHLFGCELDSCLLTEAGVLHIIRLKRKSQTKRKKKIAAAVYLYQVDNDGEWGEVSFDFETETAEIIRLAEWDTTVSKKFAKQAIRHLQTSPNYNLPKDGVMIFEI